MSYQQPWAPTSWLDTTFHARRQTATPQEPKPDIPPGSTPVKAGTYGPISPGPTIYGALTDAGAVGGDGHVCGREKRGRCASSRLPGVSRRRRTASSMTLVKSSKEVSAWNLCPLERKASIPPGAPRNAAAAAAEDAVEVAAAPAAAAAAAAAAVGVASAAAAAAHAP